MNIEINWLGCPADTDLMSIPTTVIRLHSGCRDKLPLSTCHGRHPEGVRGNLVRADIIRDLPGQYDRVSALPGLGKPPWCIGHYRRFIHIMIFHRIFHNKKAIIHGGFHARGKYEWQAQSKQMVSLNFASLL
ncbi:MULTISPECIES: hypothetical protein [Pseudomonas]|uniref:hypothetical protein n=1 Tax=Pseudomonas TaxID=286 RepID=UPI00119E5AB5|nr:MULTISPECIES: hypothetical protein [Pseudomonas]KAB0528928.1 hypothetical protein F7R20_05320 [Pseudomonas brassicacearum subsp. brassicacearum]NJP58847.1 hypothetical protein [Pseudomonas brassicacearum]QEO77761.1 hypothetical protein ELZ14_09405 [Pseudomonas brassicacearum]UVM46413.1 hypothetical protein LOY47_09140 [Pseudomonas brassicacearum]WLG69955.1 hypothetical protein PSH71_09175 [Pseudomonas brassicacearum]